VPDYRRNRVPGGTYFFTVVLRDRTSDLLTARIDTLRASVRAARARYPFRIGAWVVLPDHLHCLWTLPERDDDFPVRWQAIKAGFARAVAPGIWQRGYREHTIRDDRDFAAHMDYTHFNPVRHGFATHPADWPFSSFRHCVDRGFYPQGWRDDAAMPAETGERTEPAG
jgi:putative transposase